MEAVNIRGIANSKMLCIIDYVINFRYSIIKKLHVIK